MAVLECEDGRRLTLGEETTIGRSSNCSLVIDDESVSRDHARVWWTGEGWILRDLNSRNGTRVGGQPLGAEDAPLDGGARINFGESTETWTLVHVGPPVAAAIAGDGTRIEEQPGGLALGANEDAPETVIYRSPEGQWVAESSDGSLTAMQDGKSIECAGVSYLLELPPRNRGAGATRVQLPNIDGVSLSFRVSADEEEVQIALGDRAGTRPLPARASNYLLLHLARLRLADREAGEPERECGWIDTQLLARQLGVLETVLNVDIHRIRKRFGEAGVRDAANVIERRKGSRKLRLGVKTVQIEPA